jgi:hypothetical protein
VDSLRLPEALEKSQRVLVAGAGGGFDVYAGLPLYARLRALGKQVTLANLSFTYLAGTDAPRVTPALYRVEPSTSGRDTYFPERTLARFLARRGHGDVAVYAFEKVGVAPIREAYAHLARQLDLDAVVLVDGGTDILLRGDEQNLGTPAEDMTSLAAAAALGLPVRVVTCVGFGVDAFHGVCHAHWLENVAALAAEGAFLGAAALVPSMPEVRLYLDAVADAETATPQRPSIVNGSVASAIEGRFGDHHRTARTRGSALIVNPLMSLVWAFELGAVARRNLYLDQLASTQSVWDVQLAIEAFHGSVRTRPRAPIPH